MQLQVCSSKALVPLMLCCLHFLHSFFNSFEQTNFAIYIKNAVLSYARFATNIRVCNILYEHE